MIQLMIWMFERRDYIKYHDRYHCEEALYSIGGYLVTHVVIAGDYPCLGDFALKASRSMFR